MKKERIVENRANLAHPIAAPQATSGRAWRFLATFAGSLPPKSYLSPDVRRADPGWGSEVFNRKIEELRFYLPTGHVIVLSGMSEYCFFVEASQALSKRSTARARIEAFWICGRFPETDTVESWRIGNGQVIRKQRRKGCEWGGTPISGWKRGAIGSKPVSVIQAA